MKRRAIIDDQFCAGCGACMQVCPRKAISINKTCVAVVDRAKCVGCGVCSAICGAACIEVKEVN